MKYIIFARLFMEFFGIVSIRHLILEMELRTYTFELLENTRMQIFIHVPVFESIMGGFLR